MIRYENMKKQTTPAQPEKRNKIMQTLPPVPEGFTRASEYPKFSRNEGSDAATDKFFIRFDDFEYEMIEQMESLYFGDLTVNDVSAEPDALAELELWT